MKYFNLSSNHKIPAIGLGTWKAENKLASAAVAHALKVGYEHIDCAAIYLNEKEVGEAIKECLNKKVISRDKLFVTSKLWNSFHLHKDVMPALKQSLHDLRLDYLDLYLVHWPVAFKPSVGLDFPSDTKAYLSLDDVPLDETWQAMEELVDQGLVKSIGVSNFSISKLEALLKTSRIKPAVNQVECHPYLSQKELFDFGQKHQIHLTAYSPLGSKDRDSSLKRADEPLLLENETILTIAKKHRSTPAQVILAWQISRGVSVIPKSSNPSRIEENLKSVELVLDDDDISEINQLNMNHRYLDGTFWTVPGSPYKIEGFWL